MILVIERLRALARAQHI